MTDKNPEHPGDEIDYRAIYDTRAADYEALIAREDYCGNLGRTLAEICSPAGQTVLDLGAGTGRLTRLLAPQAAHVLALDISFHMLRQAQAIVPPARWSAAVADNRNLPLPSGCADLVLAGWSLGHFTGWYPGRWQSEINYALDEIDRVLRPAGTIIILETLGTGNETPAPPTEALSAYYDWLQAESGFAHRWLRTDYCFQSPAEAAQLTRFFFGADLARRITREQLHILPECTGLWYKTG